MSEAQWQKLDGRITFSLPLRALRMLALLCGGLALLICLSLMSGSYPLTMPQVLATLAGSPPSETAATVIWEFRFPRALAALGAGALLALSGATLQNVTRNPLADPGLVGVSQGAGLAVVIAIVVFPALPHALRPILAFFGALTVAALIQTIAMRRNGSTTMRLILTAIGIAAFLSAVTSAVLAYGNIDRAMSALGWLAGSVHTADWADVLILLVALLVLGPCLVIASRSMAGLRMGPELGVSLGLQVSRTRTLLIMLAVALAASAVAVTGPLGFVGLVTPHIAQRVARSGVGVHLALTAVLGGVLVAAADLLGRLLFAPLEIPAGLVTALIGVPVFFWLLYRSQTTWTY